MQNKLKMKYIKCFKNTESSIYGNILKFLQCNKD